MELLEALLDRMGDANRRKAHDRCHQDQADVDAVRTHQVVDAQSIDPGNTVHVFEATQAFGGPGETGKCPHGQQHREGGRCQCDGADGDSLFTRPEGDQPGT